MSYRPVSDVCLMARPKVPYYGAFPNGSLERMRLPLGAQIDDEILFVCSGRVREYPCRGVGPNDRTVDINPALHPDYVMDVRRRLPRRRGGWRAMIVDTPYSRDEARHYGTEDQYPEPDPLLKLCLEHTRPGGRVGFLHWYWPRPPREVHGCPIKEVFVMSVSTGRGSRARNYVVFEKVKPLRDDVWRTVRHFKQQGARGRRTRADCQALIDAQGRAVNAARERQIKQELRA